MSPVAKLYKAKRTVAAERTDHVYTAVLTLVIVDTLVLIRAARAILIEIVARLALTRVRTLAVDTRTVWLTQAWLFRAFVDIYQHTSKFQFLTILLYKYYVCTCEACCLVLTQHSPHSSTTLYNTHRHIRSLASCSPSCTHTGSCRVYWCRHRGSRVLLLHIHQHLDSCGRLPPKCSLHQSQNAL